MEGLREAVERAGGPKKVAEAAGISRAHLKNLYRGVRPMTVDMADLLSPLLDLPASAWDTAIKARRPRKRRAKTAATSWVANAA